MKGRRASKEWPSKCVGLDATLLLFSPCDVPGVRCNKIFSTFWIGVWRSPDHSPSLSHDFTPYAGRIPCAPWTFDKWVSWLFLYIEELLHMILSGSKLDCLWLAEFILLSEWRFLVQPRKSAITCSFPFRWTTESLLMSSSAPRYPLAARRQRSLLLGPPYLFRSNIFPLKRRAQLL